MSTYIENTRSSIDLVATSVSNVLWSVVAVALILELAVCAFAGAHNFFGLGLKKHGLLK